MALIKKSKTTCLVSRNVLPNTFLQNSKGCRDLFCISDDRDHRDNHDDHYSSEMLSDNREIAIIALAKKVAIIVFLEKLKTPFSINPTTNLTFSV
jgi:hypothetical protein